MIKKIEGIVVKEIAYRDTSKIIDVLTKDGIYSVIAKGAKKVRSPLFLGTSFLSYSNFVIYEKPNLSILKSVDVIDSFKNTIQDITRISASTYLVNLCLQVYKQNDDSDIYDLLLLALEKINNLVDVLGIVNIIEIKMLKYLGLKLHLENCTLCGSNGIYSLSIDYSGYLCRNCSKVSMDKRVLKLIKVYKEIDLNKLDNFTVSKSIVLILNKFIDEYYLKYTGLYLQSKKFFMSVLEK